MRLNYRATKIFLIGLFVCLFVSIGTTNVLADFTCGTQVSYGQTYDTMAIGTQCWLKQNLNVGTLTAGANGQGTSCSSIQKYCYSDTESYCTTDGGLYQWNQAMCGSTTEGAQGICPTGWHIPTHDEMTTLERAVCTSGSCATDFPYDTSTSGWRGTNEGTILKPGGSSDFEALLAGDRNTSGYLYNRLVDGYYWTSSSGSDYWRWVRQFYDSSSQIMRVYENISQGNSVRCVHDQLNGSCGASNGQAYTTAPTTNLCANGIIGTVYSSGVYSWLWVCSGLSGGDSAGCYALEQVDGACGSSNGGSFPSAPSTGLCASGTASSVSGSGPWTWSCNGVNGGGTASCSASVGSGGGSSTWYSTSWGYRKPITISNSSGSDLTNYQIKVVAAYDSNMQADFDDIRFVANDDATTLNYWLESKTDSSTATVWVKVPSIPTAGTTIYMYFGNASAATASSGDNTFELFDDFTGASLDTTNKWTTGYSTGGSATVASSQLNFQVVGSAAGPWSSIYSKTTFDVNYALRAKLKTNISGAYSFPSQRGSYFGLNSKAAAMYAYGATDLAGKYYNTNSSDAQAITGFSASTWVIQDIYRNASTSCIYKINDANTVTISNGVTTGAVPAYFMLYAYTAAGTVTQDVDWFLVRKYVGTEPTNSVGSKQQAPAAGGATWYSGSWSYRQPVTISNSSGLDLTDYQIKVTVPYNAHIQTNFDDIRFVTSDDATALNYWLESKTDSSTATFWVKVPSIPVTGTTIYMYYGNASASSASSGDNTFEFYDDFNSGTLDTTNKWTVNSSQSYSISSGILTVSGANDASDYILSKTTFGLDYALRSSSRFNNASGSSFWGFHDTVNDGAVFYDTAGYRTYATKSGTGSADGSNATTGATLYIYEIQRISSALTKFYQGDTLWNTVTSTSYITTASRGIEMRQYTNGYSQAHDWMVVRKIVASDPTTTLGTEQVPATCGSAAGQYYSSAPTTNLCASGTASAVFGSNPYTWTCTGASGAVVSCSTASPWYSTSWPYRKPITVSNASGSDLTDYQIKVVVPYNAHMQSDFDDIRFVSSDNVTVLNYWLESKTDSSTATFWAKLPSIPTAGTTIYVYYGNASATSLSNGDNTFVLYDHFTGASVDTSKWQSGSACTLSTSTAICSNSGGVTSILSYGNGYAFRTLSLTGHTGAVNYYEEPMSLSDGVSNQIYFRACTSTGTPPKYGNYDGSFSEVSATGGWTAGTNHITELKRLSTGAYWTIDDANSTSNTSHYSSANMYAGFDVANIGYTGSYIYTDWFLIRKVVATEPTNTVGSEESYTTTACGTANGQIFSSAPTTNLCAPGTASAVSGTGPWTWTCTSPDRLIITACSASKSGGNWLAGWSYRKPVSVNSSLSLTDYQVKIAVTYSSNMKSDFSDLRFVDSGHTTSLSYWIESYTASTSATVWVKVPSISSSGTTIYMYYGNSSASSTASGDNTFEFFDDFSAASLDTTNKWTVNSGQTNSIASGILTVKGAADASDNIMSKSTFGIGYAERSYSKFANRNASYNSWWGFGDMTTDGAVYSDATNNKAYVYKSGTGGLGSGDTIAVGTYSIYEIQRISTGLTQGYINDAWYVSFMSSISTANLPVEMREYATNYTQLHDWTLVRKIATSDPTTTVNSEENGAGASCGTANGGSYTSAPSANLCATGNASSVSGTGPWTWSCASVDGLTIASCTAIKTGMTWLTGWSYRKPISITNSSGSSLSNYQIKLTVTANSHMQPDFRDLRFTNSTHTAILNYWIETYTAGSSATVWVKVPTVSSSSGTTIYMYYGNDSVTSATSGDNTFELFDHFTGTSVDAGKWSIITQTPTVASSILTLNATAGAEIRSLTSFGTNYAMRTYASLGAAASTNHLRFYGDANNSIYWYQYTYTYFVTKSGGTLGTQNNAGSLASAYHTYDILRNGSTSAIGMIDNGTVITFTNTTNFPTDNEYVDLMGRNSTLVDWVLVRKYASPDPTNVINNEEAYTPGVSGLCGTANGTTVSSAPSSNLCATGTASSVATGAMTYTWACNGTGTGTNDSCYANRANTIVTGQCGPANFAPTNSAPTTTDLCSAGTASVISGSGPWTWTCAGISGGATDSCEANLLGATVAGSCGTANGASYTSAPTINLCAASNGAPIVTGTGPWSWTCYGSDSPTGDVSCSANKSLPKWHEESPY